MKTIATLLAALALSSCATDAQGNKTFAGLSGSAWATVGKDAAKAAAISYGTRRMATAAKQPVNIEPATQRQSEGWLWQRVGGFLNPF